MVAKLQLAEQTRGEISEIKQDRIAVEIERRFATPLYALNGTKSLFGMQQAIARTV